MKLFIKKITIVFLSFVIIVGCTKEPLKIGQILSLDKTIIMNLDISQPDNNTISISDRVLIDKVIDDLNNINVQKLSASEEANIFNNGKVLGKDTTYGFDLLENKDKQTYIMFYLLSEKELVVVNEKPANTLRSISYLNLSDQVSLDIVSSLYKLIKETSNKYQ